MMDQRPATALALVAGLLLASPALAFDVDAFIARAEAGFAAVDYQVRFGEPVVSGDTIVFADLTIVQYPDHEPVTVVTGPLVVEGVAERPDGSFTAASATLGPVDYTYQHTFSSVDQTHPVRITSGGLVLRDLYFPARSMDAMAVETLYGEADLDGWQMSVSDQLQFSIDRWTHKAGFSPDQTAETLTAMTISMTLDGVDGMLMPGQYFDDILAATGHDRLAYDMKASYDWAIAEGLLDFDTFEISAPGLGSLSGSGKATGFDADLYTLMTDLYDRMDALLLKGDADGARGLEQQLLLAAGPRVTLTDLELSYRDDGFVRHLVAENGLLPLYEIGENFSRPEERALAPVLHGFFSNPTGLNIRQTRPETFFNIWRKFPDPFEMILAVGGEVTLMPLDAK